MVVLELDRAAVLIDLGYLAKILKYCFGEPRINFEEFSDLICGDKERLRTFVYDSNPYVSPEPTEDEKNRAANHDRFVKSINGLSRFEVRLGKTAHNPHTGDFFQRGVDVLFTVDLMRLSWDKQINTAFLVTGDSDFIPAIRSAKKAGVLIILYYRDCYDPQGRPMSRATEELLDACDETRQIEEELIEACKF